MVEDDPARTQACSRSTYRWWAARAARAAADLRLAVGWRMEQRELQQTCGSQQGLRLVADLPIAAGFGD